MNVTSWRRAAVPTTAALALSLTLAACGTAGNAGTDTSAAAANVSGTLNGAGSSAQQAAQAAWAAGFQTSNPKATVNYNPVGSGGGVTKFTAGAVAFAGSDKALDLTTQVPAANATCGGQVIEVPDYISPIAVAFNVPGVTSLNLDAPTVAKLFNGSIKTWDDAAIKALNPGASLPNLAVSPIHRSDKSGTTNNFTDYLAKAGGGAWTSPASEVWPTAGGEGASGTSGVVSALKAAKGGVSYIDNSQTQGLSKASIKAGTRFVQPSAEGAAEAVSLSKQQDGRAASDYALTLNRTPDSNTAYPITLVSYLIACPSYPAASQALTKAFLLYTVSDAGQKAAAQTAGSAPLPANLVAKATALLSGITSK